MRIIAGEFRGRRLLPPEGRGTRPITDRAKQSLFDILTPRLDGAAVYDCFAGTGSMGLEALSRGASHATFFELDRGVVRRLKENIAALGVAASSRVVSTDLFAYFRDAPPLDRPADVIFFDPPYPFVRDRPADLQAWAAHAAARHLAADGVVVFRHDGRDQLPLPPLKTVDVREYGGMTIELLIRDTADEPK